MYTLLDTCLDRLDIFEFLSHVEDGLKDHYDIKVSTITWLLNDAILTKQTDVSLFEPSSAKEGWWAKYFNPEETTGLLLEQLFHTTPEKFENAALFLQLGLIRHENGAFRMENLKTLAKRFYVDGKRLENGAFQKRWRHDDHVICLPEISSNTNPRWLVIVAFSNFFGVTCTENTGLTRFRSEIAVFKFLRRSV